MTLGTPETEIDKKTDDAIVITGHLTVNQNCIPESSPKGLLLWKVIMNLAKM
jgi:hypothetical protein